MKKNTLAALILTTLAAGQLTSLQAHGRRAAQRLGRH